MTSRIQRIALVAAACWVLSMGPHRYDSSSVLLAQQATGDAAALGLEVLQLRPTFFVLVGAGANIGVQFGPDGAVVVDAGAREQADAVVAAIKRQTIQPIRYVIDTSADADHVGGNETVSKAGKTLFVLNPLGQGLTSGGAAAILSAEQVLMRMSAPTGQASQFPTAGWPTEAYEGRRKYMFLNGEGIEVLHQPAAHSDGDSVVFFRRSDVVMAGDVIDTTRFPVIDVARGGTIQGEADALTRLVELAIPSVPIVSSVEPGTYVVPGHGRVFDQLDVVEYRDMVTIIRDRVRSLKAEGMTLDRVLAATPTAGYTARYGSDTGAWTTRMFVEAIYRSLPAVAPAAPAAPAGRRR